MALRGIACNHLVSSFINPVNPQWFYTAWGDYCLNALAIPENIQWVMHLYETIPAPDDVAQMKANNPNYKGFFCVGGNEPDLEGRTPKQVKKLICEQMDAVLLGDPSAKFAVTMGSQVNAFGGASAIPFVVKVWEKLPVAYRQKVRAFHTHFYPQAKLNNPNHPDIYNPAHITAFLDQQNAGIQSLPDWTNNQLVWLTEIGLSKSALTNSDPRTHSYPGVVHTATQGKAGRWAWYGFQDISNVHCFWEQGMTPTGETFAGLN